MKIGKISESGHIKKGAFKIEAVRECFNYQGINQDCPLPKKIEIFCRFVPCWLKPNFTRL